MSMDEVRKSMESTPGVNVLDSGPIIHAGLAEPKDPWIHRSDTMLCRACMYYVPKNASVVGSGKQIGRCRRHAPTMSGYPVVYHDDWCGDHKLDENKTN